MKTFLFFAKFSRYVVLVFSILTVNFLLPRLMPGDPMLFIFGEEVYGAAIRNPDLFQSLSSKYGLDLPLNEQFLIYLGNLFRGDLGYSFSYGRQISEIIIERLPLTLMMTVPSTVLSLIIGAALGLSLGWEPNSIPKRITSAACVIIHSIPTYWLAMLLLLVFSLWLGLTPIGGAPPAGAPPAEFVRHLGLPVLVLTLFNSAYVAIIMRGLTFEISEEPFVTTALSKGLSRFNFSTRHLLRPSLPSFLSLAAIEMGFAFSGALLVEIAFSWPGMGYTMWQAVTERDYPLLQAAFTMVALIVITANAVADVLSYALDPRVRLS
ncbi:MAG: ABC transporter permease [Candidatus Verstraetearchaeota archaeon]|nr:ABC transporter permease [Candidatus Verstraetearchaeota archaeon]